MRGHVRELVKGKKYRVYVDVGEDPLTGKRRQKTRVVDGKRKDADAALVRMLGDLGRGIGEGSNVTVADFGEAWLAFCESRKEPGTVKFYRENFARLPDWFTKQAVWKVRTSDVNALLDYILTRPGWTAATSGTVHRTVRAMFGHAVEMEVISRNPASAAKPPRHQAPKMQPPTRAQIRAALMAADGVLVLWLRLAATVGARRAELGALRWRDFDFASGVVHIDSQVVALKGGGVVVKPRTKTGDDRTVPLDSGTMDMLLARGDELIAAGLAHACAPDAYVLATDPRRPLIPPRPDYPSHAWTKLRKTLGLEHVRFHDFRHAVATGMIADGVDPRTVASHLGHANPNVTLKTYAHAVPEVARAAAERHGAALDEEKMNGQEDPRRL